MIQRLQSVYLTLVALLSLLFFNGSFLSFSEKAGPFIIVTFNGIFRELNGQNNILIEKLLPLSILLILIPVISLITIFIFKNRKIQLKLSLFLTILIILDVIALIHVSISIIMKFNAGLIPGFKMILPVLMLIFSVLAYRGIRKDDQLVKSYDRLR
jgi:Domain of unknown function (DUF4293)